MSFNANSVPQELAAALSLHRDRAALRDRDLHFTYGDLAAFVSACRRELHGAATVAIYGAPGALFAATAVACVIDGRPFVHLDPAMPGAVLENIVAELKIDLILTAQPPKDGQLPACRTFDARACLDGPADGPVEAATVRPTDPIYLVATSGTTGRPKCIPVTQDAAFLSYRWRDAYTAYRPGVTVGAYIFAIWEMFRPLRHGAQVVFPGIGDLLSPMALAAFLTEHGVHEMLFTPSFLERMLTGIDARTGAGLPLARVILNGEVVGDALIAEASAKLPRARLLNLYSICETHDISLTVLDGSARRGGGQSVGHAMPHLRPVVLDDADSPCPAGVAGLLHFEGPRMLGPGYVGRPEETARRFRQVEIDGRPARLYDTGDMGRVEPDGEIVVLGRVAHMLKLRGYSIQTTELIETMGGLIAFSHAIPRVRQVGDRDQALVFYYTADAEQTARNRARWQIAPGRGRIPAALADALRDGLPAYCVPSYLVQIDEIPIHAVSGKCDFAALPPVAEERPPALDPGDALAAVAHAARLLRLPASDIDSGRSFRDHGGDSLMCVDLILTLEQVYGRRVDFDWALNLPLGRLHELLSSRASAEAPRAFDRKGIFLTGATGFLGGHVLREAAAHLAQDEVIYCLVRPGKRDPRARLDALAVAAGIPRARIVLVAGAVDEPMFGLAEAAYRALGRQVSSVIHCAATVNLAVDRERMESWSGVGIDCIVAFCRDAGADLRFSSSAAVFPERGGPHPETPVQVFDGCSGYGAAKIAAEARIAAAGVDAAIVRLPSLYDLDAPNPRDIYEIVLKASRELGHVPAGLSFPMVDVGRAAAFLVRAAPRSGTSFVNLMADHPVACAVHAPGMPALSRETWLAQAPLSPVARDLVARSPDIFRADATYATETAKVLWREATLSPYASLSDPRAFLRRRLTYQSEPALTW